MAAEIITDKASDPTDVTDYRNDNTATTTIIVRQKDTTNELFRFTEDNGDPIGTFDFSLGILSGLTAGQKTNIENAFAGDVTDIPPSNLVYDKNTVHDNYESVTITAIEWNIEGSFLDPNDVESNLDNIDVHIFLIASRWRKPFEMSHYDKATFRTVVSDFSNNKVRLCTFTDATYSELAKSETIATTGGFMQGITTDTGETVNGEFVIYWHRFSNGDIYRLTKNVGAGWTATLIITITAGSVQAHLTILETRRENGRAVLVASYFQQKVSMIWFDGAVYQSNDMNFVTNDMETCRSDSIGRLYFQHAGGTGGGAGQGGRVEKRTYNGNLQTDAIATVADILNQWTSVEIFGSNTVSSNVDGDGTVARFRRMKGMDILEEDSNNNPTFIIRQDITEDGSNEVFRVATPNNVANPVGTDWDVRTPFPALTGLLGFVDGSGSVPRFEKPGWSNLVISPTKFLSVDQDNHNFRLVTLNSKDGSTDNDVDTVVPFDKVNTLGTTEAKTY